MGKKRARSVSEIRKIAEEVLREAGITVPPVPVELIAKRLGATIRYAPFKGELAGMLIRNKDQRDGDDRGELTRSSSTVSGLPSLTSVGTCDCTKGNRRLLIVRSESTDATSCHREQRTSRRLKQTGSLQSFSCPTT